METDNDNKLYKITIEKCATQKTKFFLNGKSYRIPPEKLIELFNLTDKDMSKLHLGYKIDRVLTKQEYYDTKVKIDEIITITIL